MELQGSHVIVTGGASGLGAATAEALADGGAKVTVFDLNGDAAQEMADRLGGAAYAVDVSSPGAAEVVAKAAAEQGPIRGLVNCAGIGVASRVVGRDGPMPLEDYTRVIQVNLIGSFNMMRLVAAHMTAQDPDAGGERGAIVNTASVAAFDGQVGQAAYAASKGGIVSMALPIARELARFGIRVNTVAPGIFRTPLLANLPEDVQASISASIPFPSRLGEPSEFADAVLFALKNAYLNAEVIRLDGAVRLPPK